MTRRQIIAADLILLIAVFLASGLWVGCNAPMHINCEGYE
jgi:hypothetical protein